MTTNEPRKRISPRDADKALDAIYAKAGTGNEAAERLREAVERVLVWAPTAENAVGETMPADLRLEDVDEALAAERRAFGKRVLANFSDRIDRAWGNENAAKATDLLRWAVDEEAAR